MTNVSCPVCGGSAAMVREVRAVEYGKRRVNVDDEFMRCTECGEAFYLPGQMERTDRQAAAEVRRVGEPPLPFEIRGLRARWHLSQHAFEKLLNTGDKTAIRWELGQVVPNPATGTLLRLLIEVPEAVQHLAALHGVELPPAYREEGAKDAAASFVQEFMVPPPKKNGIALIAPYLQRANVQRVETPLSPEFRTFEVSTG
jgi:putative zinc finger/helix-turn-helix YgiT family protein